MIRDVIFVLLCCCTVISCKSPKEKKDTLTISTKESDNYFPISTFIEEQINYVNLRDMVITETLKKGGQTKKDTISKDRCVSLLQSYKKLTDSWFASRNKYKETVFEDLGTESLTINYTTIDFGLPIQRIDLLLFPKTKTVRNLFIRTAGEQYNFTADKKVEMVTEGVVYTIEWTKPGKP